MRPGHDRPPPGCPARQAAAYACTLLANQRSLVKDSYSLRVSLVTKLFLRVLPQPLPLRPANQSANGPEKSPSRCFWADLGREITSDNQAAMLKWVALLCRHFAAASLSLPLDHGCAPRRMQSPAESVFLPNV